jgi:hypothetical protein
MHCRKLSLCRTWLRMCSVLACSLQISRTFLPPNVENFMPAFDIRLARLLAWKTHVNYSCNGWWVLKFCCDWFSNRWLTRMHTHAHTRALTQTHSLSVCWVKAWHFQYPERVMNVRHMVGSPSLLQTEILHSFVKGCALNAIYGTKLSNSENQWHAFDYGADKMLSERCAVYGRKYHVHEVWAEKKWGTNKYTTGSAVHFRLIRKIAKSDF